MAKTIRKRDGVGEEGRIMVGPSMVRAWVDMKDYRDLTHVLVKRWE